MENVVNWGDYLTEYVLHTGRLTSPPTHLLSYKIQLFQSYVIPITNVHSNLYMYIQGFSRILHFDIKRSHWTSNDIAFTMFNYILWGRQQEEDGLKKTDPHRKKKCFMKNAKYHLWYFSQTYFGVFLNNLRWYQSKKHIFVI